MDIPTVGHQGKPLSVAEYAAELARNGTRIFPGTLGSFWAGYELGAMVRMPTFHTLPPTPNEVRQVLWKGRAAVASYLLDPDESHPPNAYAYVCMDRTYAFDKLPPAMRRNVRRGSSQLRIVPVAAEQLLTHGTQAFSDTRRRVGLSDGTAEEFRRRFGLRVRCPGHVFFGAWKDDTLAAFLSITEVDSWAEIEGCFSMDSLLGLRPNDALMFHVLSYYLTGGTCQIVSYGLSSIQVESNEAGLHAFKTKVGFEAQPVRRVFVVHPLLRPFVNRLMLWGVNTVLRFRPGERHFKKAGGILACMLGEKLISETTAGKSSDE
jgi:hypothetical protein